MLTQTESPRRFLEAEYIRRTRVNNRYSLRAFARMLKMSPGELSEVLKGKRCLSFKSAFKVAEALGLKPQETKHLFELVQIENAKKVGKQSLFDAKVKELKTLQLSRDLFE